MKFVRDFPKFDLSKRSPRFPFPKKKETLFPEAVSTFERGRRYRGHERDKAGREGKLDRRSASILDKSK